MNKWLKRFLFGEDFLKRDEYHEQLIKDIHKRLNNQDYGERSEGFKSGAMRPYRGESLYEDDPSNGKFWSCDK